VSTRDDDAGGDRARAEAEELAWREIVDRYGERPDVAGLIELTTPLTPPEPEPIPVPEELRLADDDETFTPPPLPPRAVISPERRLAWVGLVGSPVLLVLINVVDYSLPSILSVGLVIALIASFGYLVATMAPRDPDDDGARL
jgi:hypothetical protein